MSTLNSDPIKEKRCPVCLSQHLLPDGMTSDHRVRCSWCGNSTAWSAWLGMQLQSTVQGGAASNAFSGSTGTLLGSVEPALGWRNPFFVLSLGLTGLTWFVSAHVMVGMRGPEFLQFYLLVLISTWGISFLFGRIAGHPRIFSFMGFLLYEGVGVIRLVTGLQAGMSKFGFLVLMMLAGVALFGLRIKDGDLYLFGVYLEPSKGGGDSSGCSGSSGCGGSGCGGGGGCGGCGGS